jgi:hypothetical protein
VVVRVAPENADGMLFGNDGSAREAQYGGKWEKAFHLDLLISGDRIFMTLDESETTTNSNARNRNELERIG